MKIGSKITSFASIIDDVTCPASELMNTLDIAINEVYRIHHQPGDKIATVTLSRHGAHGSTFIITAEGATDRYTYRVEVLRDGTQAVTLKTIETI